jgi:hypothetical protein
MTILPSASVFTILSLFLDLAVISSSATYDSSPMLLRAKHKVPKTFSPFGFKRVNVLKKPATNAYKKK